MTWPGFIVFFFYRVSLRPTNLLDITILSWPKRSEKLDNIRVECVCVCVCVDLGGFTQKQPFILRSFCLFFYSFHFLWCRRHGRVDDVENWRSAAIASPNWYKSRRFAFVCCVVFVFLGFFFVLSTVFAPFLGTDFRSASIDGDPLFDVGSFFFLHPVTFLFFFVERCHWTVAGMESWFSFSLFFFFIAMFSSMFSFCVSFRVVSSRFIKRRRRRNRNWFH